MIFFFRAIREIRRIDILPRPCPPRPHSQGRSWFSSVSPRQRLPDLPALTVVGEGIYVVSVFFVKKRLFSSFFGQK